MRNAIGIEFALLAVRSKYLVVFSIVLSLLCGTSLFASPIYTFADIGGVLSLLTPAGYAAFGINDDGAIVGMDTNDGSGFLINGGGIQPLSYPGSSFTLPTGINNLGQIVGNYDSGGGLSFLYSNGVFSTINNPEAFYTKANAINDAGEIVGYERLSSGWTAYLDNGGVFTSLLPSAASSSYATGINDQGQIVGWYEPNGVGPEVGFLYSGSAYTLLAYPDAIETTPTAIDDNRDIVGSYVDASGTVHEFLYSGGIFSTIYFPGTPASCFGVDCSFGITDGGEIVGGIDFVPEPPSLFLLATGMLGMFVVTGSIAWRERMFRPLAISISARFFHLLAFLRDGRF